MQPQERRTRLKAATLARARMFLKAELGWLPGFPAGARDGAVTWVSLPRDGARRPETVDLTREHVQRSTYTWSKLVHRFPRALPRLVNADWWKPGLVNMLEWLKGAIHDGRDLPASLIDCEHRYPRHAVDAATRLVRDRPRLRRFIDALTWVHYLDPEDLAAAVRWTRRHAGTIELLDDVREGTDRLVDAFVLWELSRRCRETRVRPLLDLIGDRRAHTCPTHGAQPFVDQLRRAVKALRSGETVTELPGRPPAELGSQLLAFCRWLLQQDRGTRRRALDLFGPLLAPSVLGTWERWWKQVGVEERRLQKVLEFQTLDTAARVTNDINKAFGRLEARWPRRVHVETVIGGVRYASDPARTAFHRAALACLTRLPATRDGCLVRPAFLREWVGLDRRYGDAAPHFLRLFRRYLSSDVAGDRRLGPWWSVLASWEKENPWTAGGGLAGSMIAVIADPDGRRIALDALARCAETSAETLDEDDGDQVATLSAVSSSVEQVCARFAALEAAGREPSWLDADFVSVAQRLSRDADDFARLYMVLEKRPGALDEPGHRRLLALQDDLERAGWPALLGDTIGDGGLDAVIDLLRLTHLRAAAARPVEPPPAPRDPSLPGWAAAFPPDTHRAVSLLSRVAPDARATATRVLARVRPDDERLDREIAALEQRTRERPDDDHLAARLRSLVERRSAPADLRPARIDKTVRRLERAVRTAVLSTWKHALEHDLTETVQGVLDTERDVTCLLRPPHLDTLGCALELKGETRELALSLYRRRCGPPPWCPYEHPANRSFVDKMAAQGLDMTPWLQAPEPWSWQVGPRRLRVGFETDPLEIFLMGAYFDTCLSPGHGNFFSVVANAVDVNKRVLYARDDAGRVFGRCLLALADNGGVLVFRPYCHDRDAGFDDHVKSVAADLARRMRTVVAPRGPVSTLVSFEWYDDGPRDLCDRFACLGDGSHFRQRLADADPSDVQRLAEAAFDPHPLNALTVSMLLELPELAERPELVVALLPEIERCAGLTDDQWHDVVVHVKRAGAVQTAKRLIQQRLVPRLLTWHRRNGWMCSGYLHVIAEIDPSTAIRLLRQTRQRRIRRDEDEDDDDRRRVMGRALQELGRHRKAAVFLAAPDES